MKACLTQKGVVSLILVKPCTKEIQKCSRGISFFELEIGAKESILQLAIENQIYQTDESSEQSLFGRLANSFALSGHILPPPLLLEVFGRSVD